MSNNLLFPLDRIHLKQAFEEATTEDLQKIFPKNKIFLPFFIRKYINHILSLDKFSRDDLLTIYNDLRYKHSKNKNEKINNLEIFPYLK